jgi:hypothetical protein
MTQPGAPKANRPVGVRVAAPDSRTVPLKETRCPICDTVFDPRATSGRCPVCGEQVAPAALVTRAIPWLTPVWAWLKAGGWRVALVGVLVIYEIILFIIVWQRYAAAHAF